MLEKLLFVEGFNFSLLWEYKKKFFVGFFGFGVFSFVFLFCLFFYFVFYCSCGNLLLLG